MTLSTHPAHNGVFVGEEVEVCEFQPCSINDLQDQLQEDFGGNWRVRSQRTIRRY